MRITHAFGSALVSALALLGTAGEPVTETREIRVATATGLALNVATSNGGIDVVSTDGTEMVVRAKLSAKSAERLQAIRVSASNDSATGNQVRVELPAPVKGESEGCSLVIEVPRARGLTLKATNGPISIKGASGEAQIETSNGPITIHAHDGAVTASTSNGPIKAENISAKASLTTSNAPVTFKGAEHPFDIATSNGPVQVSLASQFRGTISLSTSNGKISLPQSAKVESQSGNKGYGNASATISFGAATTASTVRTTNAPVSVDHPE